MPELPDVEVFKRYLDSTALNQRIDAVSVEAKRLLKGVSAATLARHAKGQRFGATRRHGKYLFVELEGDGRWVVLHFGMTGFLKYYKDESEAPEHREAEFRFADGYRLVYSAPRKFGRIGLTDDPESFVEEEGLGPDALDLDLAAFRDAIAGRGAIKSRLMKQEALAGIGNVYGDEILFQAKIHPQAAAGKLSDDEVKRLHRKTSDVLERAIDAQADPARMPKSFLLPHREQGGRCPRCGGKVRSIKVGGRTTWFCPSCQKR
ncbi:MAG TPA: DNA-formamidopyrimidine glycosylase family protein [Pelomicrobium sp.]|nr:DNA-formamidopyrimidine glycosylase family protein [Pelomicrobium sp.]